MGNLKTKKKNLPMGRTNWEPSKTIFLESPSRFTLNSKKNTRLNKRVKSYSILKNTTIILPHPLYITLFSKQVIISKFWIWLLIWKPKQNHELRLTKGKYQFDLFYTYKLENDSSVQWTTYQLQNRIWR